MRVNEDYILESFGVCLVPQISISKFPILDNGESDWPYGEAVSATDQDPL